MSDRLCEDRGGYALGRRLDEFEAERASDALAHDMAALDAEMIEQGNLVCGVAMPAVRRSDRGARLAGVALVHRDHAEVAGQIDGWIERILLTVGSDFPEPD